MVEAGSQNLHCCFQRQFGKRLALVRGVHVGVSAEQQRRPAGLAQSAASRAQTGGIRLRGKQPLGAHCLSVHI